MYRVKWYAQSMVDDLEKESPGIMADEDCWPPDFMDWSYSDDFNTLEDVIKEAKKILRKEKIYEWSAYPIFIEEGNYSENYWDCFNEVGVDWNGKLY